MPLRAAHSAVFSALSGAFYPVPQPVMDDNQKSIDLGALLDEVSRDLDEYRKKHANGYGVKEVTLWWDTEKERLSMRHGSATVLKKSRREERMKRLTIAYLVAWTVTLSLNTVVSLLR